MYPMPSRRAYGQIVDMLNGYYLHFYDVNVWISNEYAIQLAKHLTELTDHDKDNKETLAA